ncbi:hypothetical protein ACGFOU_34450 [Streptomyces sp. NPDC048595]|uniref:hypothetical protein n=1 Tax=Streptomyces sp. NPDC048595 TaxID=3365576 RepID=UPI003716B338
MALSARIVRRIERDFPRDEGAVVAQLLEDVVESVGYGRPKVEERVAAAVVLHSRGDADLFAEAVDMAQRDWRDLMVVVGLAHEGWQQRIDEAFGRS